jgi:Fur family peroxide stress response transcriptional regulator
MEDAMKIFYQKCEEQNLKVTPQRVFVYQELLQATDHPSIDEIHKRVRKSLPNISFDTVYRTALSLAEIGLVNIVEAGGSKRFDANVHQHHHFRCIKCHRIIDFKSGYYDNVKIPEELQMKFHILNQKIQLEGICEDCLNRT